MEDQVLPPFKVTLAPPSLMFSMISGLSGLIQTPWLSPWGVLIVVNVLPPSTDLWNPSSLTKTSFSFVGLTLT